MPETSQLPTDMELVLKVIAMPKDSNFNGDIFGGWVMAQVDLAGCIIPSRLACGRTSTVAVNSFNFKHPVGVGDVLSFFSKVIKIGRTSVQVEVEVYAEHIHNQNAFVKVTEALLTYVAIDENGRPRPIPEESKAAFDAAQAFAATQQSA